MLISYIWAVDLFQPAWSTAESNYLSATGINVWKTWPIIIKVLMVPDKWRGRYLLRLIRGNKLEINLLCFCCNEVQESTKERLFFSVCRCLKPLLRLINKNDFLCWPREYSVNLQLRCHLYENPCTVDKQGRWKAHWLFVQLPLSHQVSWSGSAAGLSASF